MAVNVIVSNVVNKQTMSLTSYQVIQITSC